MTEPAIKAERLLNQVAAFAAVGATPACGVIHRL